MTYEEALAFIGSHRRFGKQPSLEPVRRLLQSMGNPQKRLRCIHVAGTNGKGSTCAMLASVLRCAGYRTGLFVSPYILDFCERIQVDGREIPRESLTDLIQEVAPLVTELEQQGHPVTEFGLVTALGFAWFARQNCDLVVLETGLGGTYDATNVIESPLVCAITSISLDHTAILGDTIAQIAREKGGILKRGGVTVLSPEQDPQALAVLKDMAEKQNNRLVQPEATRLTVLSDGLDGMELLDGARRLHLPLLGRHQLRNGVTALAVLDELIKQGIQIPDEAIVQGFARVPFPARLEVLGRHPVFLLDGAHNPGGIDALVQAIRQYLPGKKVVGILGLMTDKDCGSVLQQLAPVLSHVVTLTPRHVRAMPAEELAVRWKAQGVPSTALGTDFFGAVKKACDLAGPDGAVVACGSLFLAADLRPWVLKYAGFCS